MRKRRLQDYSYIIILLVVLAALVLLMTVASPYFFSWKNCRNILNQSAIYLVLSVGMTFVLCAGQIDLSVGSIIGFAGVCMGMLHHTGLPAGAAILAGLFIALGIGLVNGALVAYGKINSFIVTLSMMTILRGFVLIMTNSSSVFGFGPVFTFIGSGSVGPVNMPILLSLVIAAAGAMTLHKTKFGNYCLFLGSNEIALHRSGVKADHFRSVWSLCGSCRIDRNFPAEFCGTAGRSGI